MRIGSLVIVIWLVIGVFAAYQRHYFEHHNSSCATAGTVLVTAVAGPFNYLGVNPKVKHCHIPRPSS